MAFNLTNDYKLSEIIKTNGNSNETKRPKIIAIDFDGTIVVDNFPNIGTPYQYSIKCIKMLKLFGYKIILWTCRSNKYLEDAIKFCAEYGLIFDEVNKNIDTHITSSPKIIADYYIDDHSYPPIENMEDFWKQLYLNIIGEPNNLGFQRILLEDMNIATDTMSTVEALTYGALILLTNILVIRNAERNHYNLPDVYKDFITNYEKNYMLGNNEKIELKNSKAYEIIMAKYKNFINNFYINITPEIFKYKDSLSKEELNYIPNGINILNNIELMNEFSMHNFIYDIDNKVLYFYISTTLIKFQLLEKNDKGTLINSVGNLASNLCDNILNIIYNNITGYGNISKLSSNNKNTEDKFIEYKNELKKYKGKNEFFQVFLERNTTLLNASINMDIVIGIPYYGNNEIITKESINLIDPINKDKFSFIGPYKTSKIYNTINKNEYPLSFDQIDRQDLSKWYKFLYDSKLIGYFQIYIENNNLHIMSMEISNKYQNKGFGTYALKYFLEYIKNNFKNIKEIILNPLDNNKKLISFYEKNNFKLSGKDSEGYIIMKYKLI